MRKRLLLVPSVAITKWLCLPWRWPYYPCILWVWHSFCTSPIPFCVININNKRTGPGPHSLKGCQMHRLKFAPSTHCWWPNVHQEGNLVKAFSAKGPTKGFTDYFWRPPRQGKFFFAPAPVTRLHFWHFDKDCSSRTIFSPAPPRFALLI